MVNSQCKWSRGGCPCLNKFLISRDHSHRPRSSRRGSCHKLCQHQMVRSSKFRHRQWQRMVSSTTWSRMSSVAYRIWPGAPTSRSMRQRRNRKKRKRSSMLRSVRSSATRLKDLRDKVSSELSAPITAWRTTLNGRGNQKSTKMSQELKQLPKLLSA